MISDELLFEVATDYYVKGMLQKDIANKYGVREYRLASTSRWRKKEESFILKLNSLQ